MGKLKLIIAQGLRYLIIAGVTVFISFLFPNHAKFKYHYKQAQKWTYDDLVAPFDFPLIKDPGIYEKEKRQIEESFVPYYTYEKGIAQNVLRKTDELMASDSLPGSDEVIENLKNWYAQGVVALNPEHSDINNIKLIKEEINVIVDPSSLKKPEEILSYLNTVIPDKGKIVSVFTASEMANVRYDQILSEQFLQTELQNISAYNGKVSKGDKIVDKGEIISNDILQKLSSFEIAYGESISGGKTYIWIFAGYFLLTMLIVAVLMLYLYYHFKGIFQNWVKLAFIFMWLALFAYLVYVVENTNALSSYVIPFCITPIIIKNFYNERLALFVHIVVVLIASFLSSLGYEFTFMQIFVGIVTVLLVEETREWNKFFGTILFIFMAYALSFLGLELIREGGIRQVEWSVYLNLLVNAVLTLLAYPFIPLLERLFGFTSSISLAELNDINQPLLKQLSIKAPGTLQHSLQVANLSEAAADKIGANALLVKAGAMYHDIGKMIEPEYFIENQKDGNPHSELNNFQSAEKIIQHVTEGVKMAQKAKLPQVLIDFILTHHGTTRVEYFYRNQKNMFPDKEFDETLFRYPGPKPRTKEQTILMLADSLEAACKSLKNPTGKDIDDMVNKIITQKLTLGQLDDSELNFDELEKCKSTFSSLLRSIHHVRVEYPEELN